MPRIFRKTEYTPEERAEIDRVRKTPKAELQKTTGEKIGSVSYNRLMELLSMLRARREELGLSQTELAERMGIEASALCRLETFKAINPTVWTLCQWAESLDCEIGLDLRVNKPARAKTAAK